MMVIKDENVAFNTEHIVSTYITNQQDGTGWSRPQLNLYMSDGNAIMLLGDQALQAIDLLKSTSKPFDTWAPPKKKEK